MEDNNSASFVVNLLPGEETTGHVKSELPSDPRTMENSGFYLIVSRVCEVHGLFESQNPSGSHASLVVLQFDLGSENESDVKRFKYFHPTLTFESDSKPHPTVIDFSPAQKPVLVDEGFVKETNNISVQGNMQAGIPGTGTSLGGQVTAANTTETNRPYYYKVSARPGKSTQGRGNPTNVVSWTMHEEKVKRLGVGNMRVAILIDRPSKSNFKIKIDNWAKANLSYWITEQLRRIGDLTGLLHKSDFEGGRSITLEFNCEETSETVPEGIEQNNLRAAATKNLLYKLSYLHVPEKIKPKQFYAEGRFAPKCSLL
jgi:hypothetical protein